MKLDRLSWTGFGIVLIGWAVLVAEMTLGDAVLRTGALVPASLARADVVTLAQTAIGTGFGLAVVGTLRSGFGAFRRFFDAVLQRSAAPRPAGPRPLEPEPIAPARQPEPEPEDEPALPRAPEIVSVAPAAATPAERAQPAERRERPRNYAILPDGSVEVETVFGTRIFASLDEAREFIR